MKINKEKIKEAKEKAAVLVRQRHFGVGGGTTLLFDFLDIIVLILDAFEEDEGLKR